MDKSSRNSSTSKVTILERANTAGASLSQVKVDSESNLAYNKSKVSVKIRSLYPSRLEYTGQVSGKQYLWNTAGSVVEVDVEDSEILLAKHIGDRLCCGNSQDMNRIFELVF